MNDGQNFITASDVANYVVCPEAWRLKNTNAAGSSKEGDKRLQGREQRKQWGIKTQLYQNLRSYSKISLILLFILTLVVFIFEGSRVKFLDNLIAKYKIQHEINDESFRYSLITKGIPEEIIAFILILGLIIFMWDLFDRRKNKLAKEVGLKKTHNTISVKGSESSPTQELLSEKLKLSSKPDAVIKERNMMIPVDYHPFAKKVKDRHVAQLLVHLFLIKENTNISPEYGIIILGKERREVKLKNTEEKQKWLLSIIDEMRSIESGIPAIPLPSFYKCKSCDVQNICTHSVYRVKDLSSENKQDPEEE